ncbi:hypothetical protein LJC11_04260, partial [Bacteroidales bacterium OttesenSCG-928-I21]|nr:hypothetical protein [Bacteroidales bacterium OttesenSCG-928-I21]
HYIEIVFKLISNFLLCFSVAIVYFAILQKFKAKFKKIVITLFTSVLITIILSNCSSYILAEMLSKQFDTRFLFRSLMQDSFIVVITIFSVQIILMAKRQQQSAIEKEKLIVDNMQFGEHILPL